MAKENPMAIPGGSGGAARGPGAYSVRPKSLEASTKRAVKKQDKAAKSYVAKDLDKMEKNKVNYQRKKELDAAKATAAKNKAFSKGAGAGGLTAIAATVAAEKARLALAKKKAAEKKANTKKAK